MFFSCYNNTIKRIVKRINFTQKRKFNTKLKTKSPYIFQEINKFQNIPIEEAQTPPSSWYLSKEFYEFEMEKVFKNNWLGICSNHQLQKPGDYISGELISQPYVIVKNDNNAINAFYNVCSHHASTIKEGIGNCKELVCPYHGWTYNLNGSLTKCTNMKGIKNFKLKENGLKTISLDNIGNILFMNFNKLNQESSSSFIEFIHPFISALKANNFTPDFSDLTFVRSKSYPIKCNWKVFIDNYCDGGYHVPIAHKDLSSNLDMSSYKIEIHKKSSLQIVKGDSSNNARIGNSAVYCYLYPNIMFNRYGPWLDINVVVPINENECVVMIEWFINKELINDKKYIEESLAKSELVQAEDVWLCENVMKGIKSDAYDKGRYVPSKEGPAYQFHNDLLADLNV